MRIGFLQYSPAYLDVAANLESIIPLLQEKKYDLMVLPELFASGYHFRSREDVAAVVEEAGEGPITGALREWAKSTGATFVGGFAERAGGAFYNSAFLAAPDGSTGLYRKTHLFYREKEYFTPGDLGFPVFECRTRAGAPYRLGMMVCFDWYFPEAARTLALGGADLIAHPSNLVRKDCPRSMPIRALENHVYTITANRTGSEQAHGETLTFIGQSLICDPAGAVLAAAGPDETAVLVVDDDPALAADRRITAHNDLFEDRRPEAYRLG